MRISDWSSDVCSSDLCRLLRLCPGTRLRRDGDLSHGGDHGRGRPHDAGARGGEADRCDSRREGHRHPRLRPHDAGREARRNPRCPQDDSLAKAMTATPLPETRVRFAHFLTIPTPWMDNAIYGLVHNVLSYSYFRPVTNHHPLPNGPPPT